MKSEKLAIQVLFVTAILLALACAFLPKPATAEVTTKDGDYLVCTHPANVGGDALYIADTRSGMMVAFTYDNAAKSLVAQAVRPIADAFHGR